MALPIWGGNWNNASNAGLAYLNLNNRRSNVNNNIGLRPALLAVRICFPTGGIAYKEKRSHIPSLAPPGAKRKHKQKRTASMPKGRPPPVSPLGSGYGKEL
jgi:hypothetical protein